MHYNEKLPQLHQVGQKGFGLKAPFKHRYVFPPRIESSHFPHTNAIDSSDRSFFINKELFGFI